MGQQRPGGQPQAPMFNMPNQGQPDAFPMGGPRPQMPQQLTTTGGRAPWIGPNAGAGNPGFQFRPPPQLGQGQSGVLMQQRALADKLRSTPPPAPAPPAPAPPAPAAPLPAGYRTPVMDSGGAPITAQTPSSALQNGDQYSYWLALQSQQAQQQPGYGGAWSPVDSQGY